MLPAAIVSSKFQAGWRGHPHDARHTHYNVGQRAWGGRVRNSRPPFLTMTGLHARAKRLLRWSTAEMAPAFLNACGWPSYADAGVRLAAMAAEVKLDSGGGLSTNAVFRLFGRTILSLGNPCTSPLTQLSRALLYVLTRRASRALQAHRRSSPSAHDSANWSAQLPRQYHGWSPVSGD